MTTTMSLAITDPDLVTAITDAAEANEAEKATKKAARAAKKAEREAKKASRLHAHNEGDPEGTRRCTHADHVGERLLDETRENFYRYPEKEGKPTAWGSWCSVCRKRDSKEKRDAKANVTTPRDYSGDRTCFEAPVSDEERALVAA